MNGKAMKWSNNHRDIYVFQDGQWVKILCNLQGMDCTAPDTLPRGTEFDYNVTLTAEQEYYTETVLENREIS